MDDFSDEYVSQQKERLLSLLADLQSQGDSNKDALDVVELDQSAIGRLSRMDALQAQEMAKENERRRKAQIKRIEAALKRIEEGEYGYCVNSGNPIDKRRLELDPAAPTEVTK